MARVYEYDYVGQHKGIVVTVTGTSFEGKARITMQIDKKSEEFIIYSISTQQAMDSVGKQHVNLAKTRINIWINFPPTREYGGS